ncbi:MAG: cation:proton antiporter [Gammaproteobacteria bacterium HGW-Gammaproteobacteria-11]|nr:MAG: cation:proton antiporter [Gammaproteobacteria bacterium HGW-Gammaproteobacteria-11]
MFYLHLLAATLLSWWLAELSPLFWLLAFVGLYPFLRLLGCLWSGCRLYAMRLEGAALFVPWFIWQVFSASLDVAMIVLNPRRKIEPAVIAVAIATRDRRLVTLIGCLLTLTPGTLAVDYSSLNGHLYVHVLDTRSVDSVVRAVADIERRLMRWVAPLQEVEHAG